MFKPVHFHVTCLAKDVLCRVQVPPRPDSDFDSSSDDEGPPPLTSRFLDSSSDDDSAMDELIRNIRTEFGPRPSHVLLADDGDREFREWFWRFTDGFENFRLYDTDSEDDAIAVD